MAGSESFQADYDALAAGDGYIELRDWSVVEMTGGDRQAFLHNMCSNDIRSLKPGDACEAFCTDVKGKIVAHVLVIAGEDRLDLLTVPGQAETIITHLDRYIIREEVALRDATGDGAWCYVGTGDGGISCEFCGLPGFLMCANELGNRQRCGPEAWEALRIEAGFPLFEVDFDGSNLPQEVNRDRMAINFNKGCYLGQETIARIDALGHVNQQLVSLQFEGEQPPVVGEALLADGKEVGRVTSTSWSPNRNAPVALAMVRRGSNELGTKLTSDVGLATVTTPVLTVA